MSGTGKGPVCYRCREPIGAVVLGRQFMISVYRPGLAAADSKWTTHGVLCAECAEAFKRAAFGVLDVAPAGGPAGVRA